MFFYTSDDSETLIARKMEVTDNVTPASNSVMGSVIYKLGLYNYDKDYLNVSKSMVNHVYDEILKGGPYYANWARLMGTIVYQPYEIAIMGGNAKEKNLALQSHYLPTSVFMGGNKENLPLLKNKLDRTETKIYVCKNKTCKLPVTKVDEALKQIDNYKH